MKNYVIAHDLGTTGNKATLYDREGKLVASAFDSYETEFANTGWAEQHPEDWWRAVCNSTRALLNDSGVAKDDIACITFSGQMMGCVPLDKNARPLRKAIIWADQRSVDQEAWVADRIAREEVYRITGHRLSSSYSLTKILWLRDHQPDVYRNTYKFVHAKDSIVARLTGAFVTDPSDASSMNLYDLQQGTWSPAILQAAGLDPAQLPDIHLSTAVVGEVLAAVADEAGVAPGTPVVIGGGDGACAAAGAGVVREGSAYNYIGSSSWIALATDKPIYDPSLRTFTFGHIVPGMFMPTGTMQAAGASYQWTRDQLCAIEIDAARKLSISPYELMNLEAEQSVPGANGLLFLPYLLGERSPRWNPRARGTFIGLTIRHTRADMIRAVLEGVTFNLRVILEAFTAQGVAIDAMRLIGGGARSRFWNQIMADIFGMPVQRLSILEEATSMGAALAGGVGVGLYPDFSMIEQMNQIADVIDPMPGAQAAYDRLYPVFNAAYDALAPIYEMLADAM
ncbi:MAG: xylulokinase [Anaerolineae bacterium]|nr:xylulokinase [Anaerolineae bacterium]MCA9909758.1 xylulokinase [Anaerolineae bacterium]